MGEVASRYICITANYILTKQSPRNPPQNRQSPFEVGIAGPCYLLGNFNAVLRSNILAVDHLGLKRDVVHAHVREHRNSLFQDAWPLVKVRQI